MKLPVTLRADLLAAFIVSVLLIPQSLAYALLAGLPPQVGIYASLLPLIAYAALGSSPVLGVGPVAVLALMIAQTLGALPTGVAPTEGALILAAEVGLILGAAALLKLDALASLLSVPVLHGFETGATLAIAVSQVPVLLGSPIHAFDLLTLLREWAASGYAWQALTAVFGLGSCVLLVLARQALPNAIARLAPLALLLGTILVAWQINALTRGVALVGNLPPLHLQPSLPRLDASLWAALLPSSLLVALMAYVSSLAVAESLARRRGERVDARRELAGLAGANIVACLSGGMPVAGSFSRSILLHDAGSKTRWTLVFIALLMGLAMARTLPARAHPLPLRLRRSRLLEPDVGVDAVPADLAVGARAHQVERPALARHLVGVGLLPRIDQFGVARVRPQPAIGIGRRLDQGTQALRQGAGIHLVLLDLLGQRLQLRLGELDVGTILAAENLVGGEGNDAADQHDHDDDLDQREAGLRCLAGETGTSTGLHERGPLWECRDWMHRLSPSSTVGFSRSRW